MRNRRRKEKSEDELFRQQMDTWLQQCLNDCLSSLPDEDQKIIRGEIAEEGEESTP